MTKKQILLTGASGFIGRHIVETLGKEYDILAPTHSELDLVLQQSVTNFLQQHPVDVVIHAANVGGTRKTKDVQGVRETNLAMFEHLANCKQYFGRMIFFGSGAEYDKRRDLHLVKESEFGQSEPVDDYGYCKYYISKKIEEVDWAVNLRIFAMFGPYEDPEIRFISNCIQKVLRGEPITIFQNVFFDYVYVKDFMPIVRHFVEHKPQEKFYNIGTSKPRDLVSIAKVVMQTVGQEVSLEIQQPGLAKEYSCDNTRLLQEMPNLKFTNFEDSVRELVEWNKLLK